MKIVNEFGIPIKACAYIKYKGRTISVSTFDSPPVVVLWHTIGEALSYPVDGPATIDECIAYVDQATHIGGSK
jgi:hypothetical protein